MINIFKLNMYAYIIYLFYIFVAMGDSFTSKHILDGSNYGIWEPCMRVEL